MVAMVRPQISVVNQPRVSRVMRYPTHPFQLRTPPFGVAPFCFAPVLVGETLQKAMVQSRVVTDPIKNGIVGWWKDYVLVYVKVRDLMESLAYKESADRSLFEDMFINPDISTTNIQGSSVRRYAGIHSAVTQIQFSHLVMTHIVEKLFRDEGETATTFTHTGTSIPYWNSSILTENALNSAMLDADFDVPSEPDLIGGDGTLTAGEIDAGRRAWEHERLFGFTQLTFEEYQRQQGIRVADTRQAEGMPEVLRHERVWQYPSNTVHSGAVTSAVSWAISFKADKNRLFREPGFIVGVTVARPKVYLQKLTSPVANFLTRAIDWLPAHLRGDAYAHFKQFAASAGPADLAYGDEYWIDLRDLFMYGDQLLNFDISTATDGSLVALPTTTMEKKYPSYTDINGLFVTSGTNYVREDGVTQLEILGTVEDRSART